MNSISEISERVSRLGNAWEQFKHVNDARLNEIERKGHADPLYDEHLNKINSALDNYRERMSRLEVAYGRPALGPVSEKSAMPSEYQKAFRSYLRKGMEGGLEAYESKALSVGTAADGGYLVTPQMSETMARKIYESSPMRQLATVQEISTESFEVIEDTGEPVANWTDETTAISTETNSPQIGKNTITTYEMYAMPAATQKLLDDASVDVEPWLADKIAEKFSRLEATSFISGNGTGKPKGVVAYTAGTTWGTIENIESGTDAQITADGLIKLYYALNEAYLPNASFLMSRASVQQVRLLKEATTNQYMWQPGLAAGSPDTLLGAPVFQAADMPAPALDALSVAFGDFRTGYLIVDRIGFRVLRDPFTNKPFVRFYATKRVGGEVVNFDAIKLLKLT